MELRKIEEGVFLKKGKFGYRVVYPYKNEDGSINYFNLLTGGSWANVIKVLIIVLLILGLSYSYHRDVLKTAEMVRYVQAHPCEWCALSGMDNPEFSKLPTKYNWSIILPGGEGNGEQST